MLLRELKSNLFFKLSEAILVALILLLSNSILAKHLSLANYGIYSLGMFWSLIVVILTFGFSLPTLLSRELCQREARSTIISNVFVLQLVLALIVLLFSAALFFSVPYFADLYNWGFMLYMLASMLLAAPISMQGILSSQERMGAICFIRVSSYLLNLFALLIIARLNLDISWVFASHLILVFGFAAGFYFSSDTSTQLDFKQTNFKEIQYLFKQSAILVLVTLFLQLYSKVNLLMIDLMLGKESVATYAGASRIMEYMLIIATALNAAVFPNMMKLAGQPEKFWKLYGSFIRLLVYGLFPACIGIIIYAEDILSNLYGQNFTVAASTLRVLMFACCLSFLNSSFYNIFLAHKKQNIYLAVCIGALLINMLGNSFLIPHYADTGAAISTLLTEAAFFMFCYFMTKAAYLRK